MKPYFFINCSQTRDKTDESDETDDTGLLYFSFLSESKKGNRICLRFYDEFMREFPDFFIYQYEKDDQPEKIKIPFKMSRKIKTKILINYEIYDLRLSQMYFSGQFVLITKEYSGSLDVAFVCASDSQMNGIFTFDYNNSSNNSEINTIIWNNVESFNFDVLYHCGNYSKISELYNIYKKNSSVLEIFSIFRKSMIDFYQNEAVAKTLSRCWNFNFFNELDTIKLTENDSSIQREFIYYLKILYERYFNIASRGNRNYFNTTQILGSIKLISLDCYMSMFYENSLFSDILISHLLKNLDEHKVNFLILSRPLRYLDERDPTNEKILRLLLELTKVYRINLISSHKEGISYIQTHHHYVSDLKLDECICSGFNLVHYRLSFFQKFFFKYIFKKIRYFDRIKNLLNSEYICTDDVRHFGYNKSISFILSNFMINITCDK